MLVTFNCIVAGLLNEAFDEAATLGKPWFILFLRTSGDLVAFYPYIHALVDDGAFANSGAFLALHSVKTKLLVDRLSL